MHSIFPNFWECIPADRIYIILTVKLVQFSWQRWVKLMHVNKGNGLNSSLKFLIIFLQWLANSWRKGGLSEGCKIRLQFQTGRSRKNLQTIEDCMSIAPKEWADFCAATKKTRLKVTVADLEEGKLHYIYVPGGGGGRGVLNIILVGMCCPGLHRIP